MRKLFLVSSADASGYRSAFESIEANRRRTQSGDLPEVNAAIKGQQIQRVRWDEKSVVLYLANETRLNIQTDGKGFAFSVQKNQVTGVPYKELLSPEEIECVYLKAAAKEPLEVFHDRRPLANKLVGQRIRGIFLQELLCSLIVDDSSIEISFSAWADEQTGSPYLLWNEE